MTAILRGTGLSKSFVDGSVKRQILTDLSLAIAPGEVLALCGPSGSGKSTLLNVLAGVLAPDSGSLLLATDAGEIDLTALDEAGRAAVRRRYLGYVFQFFNLVPTLTVRENILLPLELAERPELRAEAEARLIGLGLEQRLDAFPEQLSGGERQRTAIARALAHRPLVVLADEPTGNLDAQSSEGVVELLWREVRDQGCAMVVATHSERLEARADRVLRLDRAAS